MWNQFKIIRFLKNIIPLKLKLVLIKILVSIQYVYYKFFKKSIEVKEDKKKIYVMLSTDYSNLGDHALTYAHIKYLEINFPECEIIEILVNDTLKVLKSLKKEIKPEDIITLKGGGNIGIEYFREELYRRIIINSFKYNKIIIFPQTIYFPDSRIGNKEFKRTIDIILKHQNLHLFIRDQKSYDLVKKRLNKKVFLVPDIVLSLDIKNMKLKEVEKREGILLCFRNDKEGIYQNNDKEKIINLSREIFDKVDIEDTVKDYSISIDNREKELKKMLEKISQSKIVITDRLHGMIFCAITKTPCIVLKTYNHKLTGQYEWLKNLNYIKYEEFDLKNIRETMSELEKIVSFEYNPKKYSLYFNKIKEVIKEEKYED